MSLRTKTLALLTAGAAVGTAASAQTYGFSQNDMGRIVPARFGTLTQMLVANVDVAVTPTFVPQAVATDAADATISIPSDEVSTWNAVAAIDGDDETNAKSDEAGFLGSTMGRVSIVGLAGLAGASYFALRSDTQGTARNEALFDTEAAPTFTANPEPASIALMGAGLLGLGIAVRRRRRTS